MEAPTATAPSHQSYQSSTSSSSSADFFTPLLSFVEPSLVNLTLFPLLLLCAYLYLHRAHLSWLAAASMVAATAAYLLAYVTLMHDRLQSPQSRPHRLHTHTLHDRRRLMRSAHPTHGLLTTVWRCRCVVHVGVWWVLLLLSTTFALIGGMQLLARHTH